VAPGRLLGVLLNDVGPEVAPEGIADIMAYLGLPPPWRSHAEAAAAFAVSRSREFPGVDAAGWLPWVRAGFAETPEGLALRYDPRLREAVAAQLGTVPAPDLWPLFDALAGIPLALLRGANSRLLAPATAARMRERRPDLIFAEVPRRGHVPFLDEAESLAALRTLLDRARSPS
jgi:pimeloyl-ACP methyl ester carboxylesterase